MRALPGQAVPDVDHCGCRLCQPIPGSVCVRQIRSGMPWCWCSHTPSRISSSTCASVHGSEPCKFEAVSMLTAPVPSARRFAPAFASARVSVPMNWPRSPS